MAASEARMRAYDAELRADDERLRGCAWVEDDEGCIIALRFAFLHDDPEDAEFFWMFAEHHAPLCFARDEVERRAFHPHSAQTKPAERLRDWLCEVYGLPDKVPWLAMPPIDER